MSNSALSKLIEAFKTPQHDYKVNTEIFGQFDPDKVAKELKLEKVGAEKGKLNQPCLNLKFLMKLKLKFRNVLKRQSYSQ